jgi:uncharacterized protein (TIGR02118 family)
MMKVSVVYPAGDGNTFDMEYYKTTHMDIVRKSMPGVGKIEIDQGMDGPYMAGCHLYFDSMETLQQAMGSPTAADAQADVPNFTNTTPSMQVSQVVD